MAPVRYPVLLAAVAGATSCNPSPQEVGQQILIVAPLVFLLSLALQWVLLRVWRRRWPDIALRWRTNLLVACALVPPAALAFALGHRRDELGLALLMFGASYAAVLLVLTRLVLWRARSRAFTLPHLPALVLFLAPAFFLALGLESPLNADAGALYLYPGMDGWVPAGLFAALTAEALLRTRRVGGVRSVDDAARGRRNGRPGAVTRPQVRPAR